MTGKPLQDPADIFVFADDRPVTPQDLTPPSKPWRVLVVDDDPDVHISTAFALDLTWTLERPIELLRAESAAQARQILAENADIAVVLLDVVMETADAGLLLVDYIRRELGLSATRIVLRTGQPGYAPEHETLARYDINDYRSKSELTQHKLVSALMAAVRAYEQVRTIEASRRGLQQIVLGSAELMQMSGLQRFADGVLTQVAALLGVSPHGLVCAQGPSPGGPYTVLAAAGPYAAMINQPLECLNGRPALLRLREALQHQRNHLGHSETVLYVGSERGMDMAIYLPTALTQDEITLQLLDVLCVNLSACLRNLNLVQRAVAAGGLPRCAARHRQPDPADRMHRGCCAQRRCPAPADLGRHRRLQRHQRAHGKPLRRPGAAGPDAAPDRLAAHRRAGGAGLWQLLWLVWLH
ncbi:MAG: hypothetical protein B7X56_03685 [Burkholderiales bacterium 34-67-9]|nr:MAG: hypothetical protein B7X56_03685 [Burkholderiales bacterium 34-67-9]